MEKITIHQDQEAINRTHREAQAKVDLLNLINAIKPFNNTATVQAWASGGSAFIQKLFFEQNPEAEKLAAFTKQEFILPPHLLNLQNLLGSVKNLSGTFTKFDSKKKIWVIDLGSLEVYCDRFKKFAETPEQIARWKFANDYCDFINQIRPGTSGRKNFVNEIADLRPSQHGYSLTPKWQFVTSEYLY